MQVLGAVGPGARELCERLASRVDGRVALVTGAEELDQAPPEAPASPDVTFELGAAGKWAAAGGDRTLRDVLDDLAATYDYAFLAGFPDADVPTVALADATAANAVTRAETVADVDVDSVLETVADAEPHVTLEALVERVKASPRADRAGAIATFTGRVRAKDDPDDPQTLELTFEKYEGVADDRMRAIESELEGRDGVYEVELFHRTGTIESGEDIVFVVVLAGHREEAFETVADGINRLKDEVPIFKRERTVEEDFWVHDRP
ncbi:MAG: molybdopterin synthase [Haloquadratum sp.]